jgi:flagellar biosynthesis protein FliQ
MAITPEFIVGFSREAMELTLVICLPMMAVGLAVGVLISIFQAATQIQDATLSLVPKLVAMFVALILAFPWIMDKMITYTTNLLLNIPTYLR